MSEDAKWTHVIVNILPTNVQQRIRKVAMGHLEAIVQNPKRSSIALRNSRETTARRRVRLEHDERQRHLLCDSSRVQVRREKFDASLVGQEHGEVLLGVLVRADTELRETIVIGVPKSSEEEE